MPVKLREHVVREVLFISNLKPSSLIGPSNGFFVGFILCLEKNLHLR